MDPTIRPDHRRNRTTGRLGDRHNDHQPGCCRAAHRCPLRRAHPPRCRRDLLCEKATGSSPSSSTKPGCDPLGREGKNAATLGRFYELSARTLREDRAVSMDMAYASPAATRKATNATICWDPFHVVMHLNKAVTATIRWSKLTKTGLPLSGDDARDLRWALLKKPGDHTRSPSGGLKRHQRSHHSIWRAQQLKERFRGLYQLDNPTHAAAYLDRWLASAFIPRIRPMAKVSQLVRTPRPGSSAVELGLSNSRLEGTNSKIRLLSTIGATDTTAPTRSSPSSTSVREHHDPPMEP
ncbi:MAG: transposase [Candidatus Microthrix sp.]|uniref:transposase n=1 Tax=Candidatus Neomicrothrix sp. TaxID=2719034 RepID=UPI0025BB1BB0|nr:transposase [Candidatus Microthrix sp.]MBL0205496.1 transposase [Candidatus Microthrix sp.]